jgi:DNA-binding SARP family transcriptional activator/uncharacterized protein HemY
MVPQLPYTNLVGQSRIGVIEKEDLAFTQADISPLQEVYPTRSTSDLQQKISAYEGWTTGIILSLRPVPAILQSQFDSNHIEKVFASLAETLFEQQAPPVREFLLRSSVMPVFTEHLCQQVLGMEDIEEPLAVVHQHRLFIEKGTGGWRYHILFREFLQIRLKQGDPVLYRRLHQQVADWFEARNEVELAFGHYLEAENIQTAVNLVEMVAHAYFIRGRHDALQQFAKALADHTPLTPNLNLVMGMHALNQYQYEDAHHYLGYAERQFVQTGRQHMVAEVNIQRANIQLQQGNVKAALRRLETLRDMPGLPDNLQGHVLRVLGVAHIQNGDTEAAIECLENGLEHYQQLGDDLATSTILQDLQVAYLNGGYIPEAENALQQLVAIRRQIGNPGELAIALNNLGYYHHTCGDYQRAREVFEEGLALVRAGYHARSRAYLLWSYGDLLRDLGQFKKAHNAYREGLDLLGEKEAHLRFNILISFATLCQWMGATHEALTMVIEAQTLAETFQMHAERQIAEVYRLLNTPSYQLPYAELVACYDGLKVARPDHRLPLMMVIAHSASAAGDASSTLGYLQKAEATAHRFNQLRPLAAHIIHMPALFEIVEPFAHRLPKLWRVIRDLLEIQNAPYRQVSGPVEPTLHRLSVQLLGTIRIEHDGATLTSSDWRSKRSLELFLYLLLNGRTRREELIEVFWSDLTAKKGRNNFHTTLYRAREAFGKETIIEDHEWYEINPAVHIDCDALKFKEWVEAARPLSPRTARAEDLWSRAAALWRGCLMPTLYSCWVTDLQDLYHQMAVEVWIGMGDCARARQSVAETVTYYESALRESPFREDVYRRLLSTLAGAGKRGELVRYWRRLQQLYRDELQTTPSIQTRQLVQQLLA